MNSKKQQAESGVHSNKDQFLENLNFPIHIL